MEGDQIQAHTQGGNGQGSDPGPHPRRKWTGIRSRPTPKGEIEGDQIQASLSLLPPRSRLRHMVNERPVRILLECILVPFYILNGKSLAVASWKPHARSRTGGANKLEREFAEVTMVI